MRFGFGNSYVFPAAFRCDPPALDVDVGSQGETISGITIYCELFIRFPSRFSLLESQDGVRCILSSYFNLQVTYGLSKSVVG